MRKIEYVVRIHYVDFVFKDGGEALDFANIAALAVGSPDEVIEITLNYMEGEE